MKVEIWSDHVCPFCYIGKVNYEKALEQFSNKEQINTEYKSFELDPSTDSSKKEKTIESLARKYGVTLQEAEAMTGNVIKHAQSAGLTFKFDNMIAVNTFDAHRLMILAERHQLASQLSQTIFAAYFTNNLDISDHEILTKLAIETGLPEDEVKQTLSTDQYAEEVRNEIQEGSQLGIKGVPFFVIDRKYAISGAQPVEVFLKTLQQAWSEKNPSLVQVEGDNGSGACDASGCSID